jgi:4-hydroxybenzoate polyprenyltransferase
LLPCAYYDYYTAFWTQILSHCHHSLCWLQNFLAGAIILALGTRENIRKVLRVTLFSVFAIVLTPIIDLIASYGKGLNVHYPYPKSFSDFFPIPRDFTIGMAATAAAIMSITFAYALIKTRNIFKSAVIILGLYASAALSFLLPFLLRPVMPLMATRAFMVFLAVEIVILVRLWDKNLFRALRRDIRITRAAHYQLMFLLGIAISSNGLISSIAGEWLSFLLMLIVIFFSWIGAVMVNNIADVKIDRITSPGRPLVTGAVALTTYSLLGWSCLGLAALCAFMVSPAIAFLTITGIGISVIYSLPPFRFKRIPLFSKTMIAAASLLMVVTGYVFAGMPLLEFPRILIWYFLIFAALALNFIDLKDIEGDKAAGILTIPVVFGEKKAKIIIGLFFIAAYLAAGIIVAAKLNLHSILAVILIAAGIGLKQFFFLNDKKGYKENRVLLTYLASLILFLFIFTLRR